MAVIEIEGASDTDQSGEGIAQAGTAGRTSGSIAAGGDVASFPQLAVAFAWTDSESSTDAASAHSWSNGFTEIKQFGMGSASGMQSGAPSLSVASKSIGAIETPSTTFTWTGDGSDEAMGFLVTVAA